MSRCMICGSKIMEDEITCLKDECINIYKEASNQSFNQKEEEINIPTSPIYPLFPTFID